MDYWQEYEEKVLVKMRQRGLTAYEIAKAMGRTRNSVIGKLDRLGLIRRRTERWLQAKVDKPEPPRPPSPPRRFSWEQTT
jgi:hypothetical protein